MIKFEKFKTPALICLILFLLGFGIYTTWRTHDNSTDFDTYYFAAKEALAGASVYLEHKDVSPYIYPPFFACLIAPLAFFGMEVASFIWYALSITLASLSLFMCFRFIFGREKIATVLGSIPLVPKALFLVVASGLLLDNLSMLQVNIMLIFLILAAIYFFKRKMDIPAGLFLAAAISIKITPVLFLIYFAVKREFRLCIFTVLWGIIFSLGVPSLYLGFGEALQGLIAWTNNMLLNSVSVAPNQNTISSMFNPENQSVAAFFSRLLVKNDFSIIHLKRMAHEYPVFLINWNFNLSGISALWASKVIVLILLITTFGSCLKKIKDRLSWALNFEYALVFLAALIANPILKTQQMIFLLFPALFVLSRLRERGRNYRLFYFGFLSFCVFYLLQADRIFKILGGGTLSILCLWGLVLIGYREFLSGTLPVGGKERVG